MVVAVCPWVVSIAGALYFCCSYAFYWVRFYLCIVEKECFISCHAPIGAAIAEGCIFVEAEMYLCSAWVLVLEVGGVSIVSVLAALDTFPGSVKVVMVSGVQFED